MNSIDVIQQDHTEDIDQLLASLGGFANMAESDMSSRASEKLLEQAREKIRDRFFDAYDEAALDLVLRVVDPDEWEKVETRATVYLQEVPITVCLAMGAKG